MANLASVRLRPEVVAVSGLVSVVVFATVALTATGRWGATGALSATLAGVAAGALVSVVMLRHDFSHRLAMLSFAAAGRRARGRGRCLMASPLTASVVVPTRDRLDQLVECLTALDVQTTASFEVIVVDDASRDGAGVTRLIAGFPKARLVRGDGRGPAAARNLGASSAHSAIVCFTDDDCRPSPHWLEALVRELEFGADAVAGRTLAASDDPFAEASQTITNHLMDASADGARQRFVRAELQHRVPCRRHPRAAVRRDLSARGG